MLALRAIAIAASFKTTNTSGSMTRRRPTGTKRGLRGKRREHVREYLRWLRPHRYAVGALFLLALLAAGLELLEPLFMRFIIDKVLLSTGLDPASRLGRLQLAGALFVGLIVLSNLMNVLK